MGGQTDFLSQRNREVSSSERGVIWRKFLGGSQDDVPETYRLASPLVHLDKHDPPAWLITGENDSPSTRAPQFLEQMTRFGIANGVTTIKDAPHTFTVQQSWFDTAMDKAEEFFIRHLKRPN